MCVQAGIRATCHQGPISVAEKSTHLQQQNAPKAALAKALDCITGPAFSFTAGSRDTVAGTVTTDDRRRAAVIYP